MNDEAMFETYWDHQLVPRSLWTTFQDACQGPVPRVEECATALDEMEVAKGYVNSYALDYPLCTADVPDLAVRRPDGHFDLRYYARPQGFYFDTARLVSSGRLSVGEGEERLAMYNKRQQARVAKLSQNKPATATAGVTPAIYDPCVDDYATGYLNRADVQAALHAKAPTPFDNGQWAECARGIGYSASDSRNPMMPVYQDILASGSNKLRYLVFSGDDDSVCATIGTQNWIYDLGYTVRVPWHQWTSTSDLYDTETAVAGFHLNFNTNTTQPKFAFVTMHGAGHEVPTYKPGQALELLQGFLAGTWF